MCIAIVGEALIDLIAGSDDTYRPHLGGSPYNVAIGLARQGVPAAYLSPLASDFFGDRLSNALQTEGVVLPITRRSPWPTSIALVTVDEGGFPTYRLYREGIADKDTSYEDIRKNLPSDVQLFHTGSLAITPSQLPKMRSLFEYLRGQGIPISVDINVRLGASVDTAGYLAGIKSLFPYCDILKASDEDLRALELAPGPRSAAEIVLASMPPKAILLLTKGRGGALLMRGDLRIEKPGYPIGHVEDTVGAGDTFHSAFLAALYRSGTLTQGSGALAEKLLEEAVDYACAAASINVSRAGCSPPTDAEVRAFIEASDC